MTFSASDGALQALLAKVRFTQCSMRYVWLVGFLSLAASFAAFADVAPNADEAVELVGDSKKVPVQLEGVGVKEHLGETVNLDLQFTSAVDGKKHALREYFQTGKPVLLNLVYFECPMLCTLVLNGVTDGLRDLDWTVGDQFQVVTISIDPRDDAESALAKRQAYLDHYLEQAEGSQRTRANETVQAGWDFLSGSEDQIAALSNQLGFQFKYDEVEKEFAHPAVTFVMTPEGKISRYLYGIQYRARDLRLSLLEASQGKIGNVFDRLLMFCYHYEPSSRGYTLQAVRVMQAGGVSTLALLGGYLAVFWSRQRKGKKNDKAL